MFVYGVRCAPNDLVGLPADARADYYMDYGLLIFPEHTRPTLLKAGASLSPAFWHQVRLVAQFPNKTHRVISLEQPWLSEGEGAVVDALQEFYPGLQPDWYYVPRTAPTMEALEGDDEDADE
jgi:hypothetical protein